MIVPNPISFLPQIISITKNPRFRRIKKRAYSIPTHSASAITIPLKGSFPSPESLNIAIPKPRIIFPINITTTYFQFIFLIHSLIFFSSVKLTLSIISDSKILYNILSVNCFPLFLNYVIVHSVHNNVPKIHSRLPAVMEFWLVCLVILAYSCQNTSRDSGV